ncbi:MAG: NIF family HAD-type phosphatase [Sutterella sp.]|nr:NIF family HAD-type phosphatase [Sutterella sp.]
MAYAIFDLDGTLADPSHRMHYLEQRNWNAFYAHCAEDPEIKPMAEFCRRIADVYEILIFTGRTDVTAEDTVDWLEKHQIRWSRIFFRKEGDFRKADQLKREWLGMLDRDRIAFAVDREPSVIEMFRKEGVMCFSANEQPR